MLPLVELVEQCRGAVDEVIDVTGRAAIQAVLELSAQQVTGGKLSQPGKKRRGDVVRWGRQPGRVKLSNRKLRVSKPRLRKRSGGEVKVPAYEAMQDDERLGARMLDILMKGVLDAQLCRGDWRNGRHGRGVEIRRQPGGSRGRRKEHRRSAHAAPG